MAGKDILHKQEGEMRQDETSTKRKIEQAIPQRNKRARVSNNESEGVKNEEAPTPNVAQPQGEQVNISIGTSQTTRSGRVSKPIKRMQYVHANEVLERTNNSVPGEILAMEAMFDNEDNDLELKAMQASVDPDTMYLHKAMQ